ncbi:MULTISPECIES: energy transducer TonB [unclassified Myroides]|uniref:energy transducer TonB n=1 Tax=unclassified Myroides TaxID=2642485 RepID=UPI003D2F9640
MAKNDLFKKDWLDIVFAGRNKQYGAYKLRLESPRTTLIALGSGLCLFGLVFVVPAAISSLFDEENPTFAGGEIEYVDPLDQVVELEDLVFPKEEVEEPEPIIDTYIPEESSAPASSMDVERFTILEVAAANEIVEEPAKQEDLVEVLIGNSTIEGAKEGTILIKEEAGTTLEGVGSEAGKGHAKEMENKIYRVTTESATPMEGLAHFSKSFISKFREIHIPNTTGGKVQVILSFVVEKDGSITDIKVMRDPGYGAGTEAVRVLKTMPKWKPARQDNRAVRSQFTLPITIQVQ